MTLEKKTMHHFLIEIEIQQLQVVVQLMYCSLQEVKG